MAAFATNLRRTFRHVFHVAWADCRPTLSIAMLERLLDWRDHGTCAVVVDVPMQSRRYLACD